MRIRNLIVLAIIAAGVLYAALTLRETPDKESVSNVALYSELATKANDITRIEVRSGEKDFALSKGDTGWGIEARGGYPADIGKVREFVQGVSALRILEEKTSDPERYDQLSLGDPETEGAESVRYQLSAGDSVLASFIVGKTRSATADVEQRELYVRKTDDPQSYLVQGDYTPGQDIIDWVDDEVVAIDASRIDEVYIEHTIGDPVIIRRQQADGDRDEFELADIPQGYELKINSMPREIVSAFTSLDFEDVYPDEGVDYGEGFTASVETNDGLRIRMQSGMRDGEAVARFTAMVGKPVVEEREVGDDAADPSPDATTDGANSAAESDSADASADTPAGVEEQGDNEERDIGAEIEELNARWSGWVYRVRNFKYRNIAQNKAELIKAEPEADPDQDAGQSSDNGSAPPSTGSSSG